MSNLIEEVCSSINGPVAQDEPHGLKISMDEHAMTQGVVPVRAPSYFPRVVKLPRRYEKAALGDPKTARHRKVSLCGAPLHMRQSISDRMDDLMTAVMWVKQELILLRQHDILLKRQFFEIHDSLTSIQNEENSNSSSNLSISYLSSSTNNYSSQDSIVPSSLTSSDLATTSSSLSPALSRFVPSHTVLSLSCSPSPAQSPLTFKKNRPLNGLSHHFCGSSQSFSLDNVTVRESSSASVLNNQGHNDSSNDNNDHDTDGDDIFDPNFFRPRTSSMKTTRDLAALARRRGSKDLV